MKPQEYSVILVNPPVSEKPWPPFLQIMIKGLEPAQYTAWPMEHLGLMSIKASAEKEGITIHVIDGIVEQYDSSDETWNAIVQCAEDNGMPVIIGFSSMIAFLQNIDLASRAKKKWPDVVTVFGQDFATLNWERILYEYPVVDVVSLGDGELTFPTLVKRVFESGDYTEVPGTAWRDSATGQVKKALSIAVNLDKLPWPDRSSYMKLKPLGFSPAVFSSRGCPYRCKFCTTGAIASELRSDGYRLKSIPKLVDEIDHLYTTYNAKFVTIVDDLFLSAGTKSKNRAAQFANELLSRGINIHFMFDTRVDAIERELFELLYSAGLRRVVIGLETGDVNQLSILGKNYSKTQSVVEKLAILTEMGIETVPGIVAFHPFVTPAELKKTLALLDAINYKNLSVLLNRIVVYPGTPLYDEYKRDGLVTDDDWPVGQWSFEDPLAEEMYQRMAKGIKAKEYPEARRFIDTCLNEWQCRIVELA